MNDNQNLQNESGTETAPEPATAYFDSPEENSFSGLTLSEAQTPKSNGSALAQIIFGIGYFVLFFAVSFAVVIAAEFIYAFAIAFNDPTLSADKVTEKLIQLIERDSYIISCVTNALVLATLLLIHLFKRDRFKGLISVNSSLPFYKYLLAFFAGVFGSFAVNALFWLLPQTWLDEYSLLFSTENMQLDLFYILAVVILAPIVEELIFRQLMVTRFSKAMPSIVAVIVIALLFGVAHWQKVQSIYAALFGFALGLIFIRSGTVLIPMLTHFAFNLMSIFPIIFNRDLESMTETEIINYNAFYYYSTLISIPLFLLCTYFLCRKRHEPTNQN